MEPDDQIEMTANGLVGCEVKEPKMDSVQLRKQVERMKDVRSSDLYI